MTKRKAPRVNRSGNSAFVGPASRLRGDEFDAFDALPRELRRALHEGVCPWSALENAAEMRAGLRAGLNRTQVAMLLADDTRRADLVDVEDFARVAWPAQYGAYPHLAAGASILRYDERRIQRERRA